MLRLLLIPYVTLSLLGCGQLSSRDNASGELNVLSRKSLGTCDRRTVSTVNLCMEAVGSDYNDQAYLEILQSSCETSGGVFTTDVCDATQSFGTCIVAGGEPNVVFVSYYPPQYTEVNAPEACEAADGVFYLR